MQRRDFLTATGRYTLYGALAVIAAFTLKNADSASDTTCNAGTSCRECTLLSGCTLEESEEARSAERDRNS